MTPQDTLTFLISMMGAGMLVGIVMVLLFSWWET